MWNLIFDIVGILLLFTISDFTLSFLALPFSYPFGKEHSSFSFPSDPTVEVGPEQGIIEIVAIVQSFLIICVENCQLSKVGCSNFQLSLYFNLSLHLDILIFSLYI